MNVSRSMRAAVAAALLCLALGCSSAGNLDICNAICDEARRCIDSSDADAVNCHNACAAHAGASADMDRSQDMTCRNAAARRAETLNCYHQDCSQVIHCLGQVEDCISY